MAESVAHPRDTAALEGQTAQEEAFLSALDSGRLHHAWLLTGPEGVGKATFAYHAARRLLGAARDPAGSPLSASLNDPVSKLMAARSHPDLMVLERDGEDGKPRKVIPVDEARRLPEFFSKAPARAAYRVAIIDAADDLNINAANAILKTLEEPPARGVLLLVSHSPGRLLPTIRSRCRTLSFRAPDADVAAQIVRRAAEVDGYDAARLVRMAGGAPGLAIRLAAMKALEVDDAAHEILNHLDHPQQAALLSLADGFRGVEGAERFQLLFERLADRIRTMAVDQALAGTGEAGDLDRWAEAWETLVRLPREAEAINLDRADSFWTAIRALKAAAA
ncbi:MAG: DNA polymerase III subunit delta' [Caulobacter sp.]|nr:DNA polymerase III subunit delta' [Caulobacter sp.]